MIDQNKVTKNDMNKKMKKDILSDTVSHHRLMDIKFDYVTFCVCRVSNIHSKVYSVYLGVTVAKSIMCVPFHFDAHSLSLPLPPTLFLAQVFANNPLCIVWFGNVFTKSTILSRKSKPHLFRLS